ncbi:hypothetical protein MUN88_20360 [Gracilibacillus caseinilyticus]|uniref:RNA polymerase sigma factor 70 region 4 type 2 domain-containing protein n=1 Tax=Gracilibacillus caseinilyticus TaxID=2932256 RepID=A0ABY4EXK8_9BACI|nr:sigma factor-like helix-turn-helix DNA-binding protein [Gracilibacillus caseinilyticus]UOQ48359.1 hypothetical protein MUN88_20360 [Gracilibacillus caseinilyticus]
MNYATAILESSNPIVKNFVNNPEFKNVVNGFLINPCEDNLNEINLAFKKYFLKIKSIAYFSKITFFEVQRLDKNIRSINEKSPLILDAPIKNDSSMTLKDTAIAEKTQNLKNECNIDIEFDKAWNNLTKKQQVIIYYHYFEGYKDLEIASIMKVSPQAISKSKKQGLKKLRMVLDDG